MAARRRSRPGRLGLGGGGVASTLRELESIARKVGAPVRYEAMRVGPRDALRVTGRGGLVRVRGVASIVCDETLPPIDKVFVVAEALAALDVEYLHLPNLVRSLIRKRPAQPPADEGASLGDEDAGLAGGDADAAADGATLHQLRERPGR
ncbi:MAG: hypothetical protein JNL79_09260 [Myxococcales bacterium]|nr:hypothetical protein [Myxococcales bacterium]